MKKVEILLPRTFAVSIHKCYKIKNLIDGNFVFTQVCPLFRPKKGYCPSSAEYQTCKHWAHLFSKTNF